MPFQFFFLCPHSHSLEIACTSSLRKNAAPASSRLPARPSLFCAFTIVILRFSPPSVHEGLIIVITIVTTTIIATIIIIVFPAVLTRGCAGVIVASMDYPDLECQTFFSLLCRFPFMRKLVVDTFTQCYVHLEEFVQRPRRSLSVTCSHSISDTTLLSSTYSGGQTSFSVSRNSDRCSQFGSIRSDRGYISVSRKSVEAYGVHFESRNDVNFWFDANQRARTFFVSAMFSDEWEAWTQLASNACAGLRYSTNLTPSTFLSCGVQSSRSHISGAVSVFQRLQESCSAFLNVIVSPTAICPLVAFEKVFSWISVRYIQGLKSCACELRLEPKGIAIGCRLQRSNAGMQKVLFFAWT